MVQFHEGGVGVGHFLLFVMNSCGTNTYACWAVDCTFSPLGRITEELLIGYSRCSRYPPVLLVPDNWGKCHGVLFHWITWWHFCFLFFFTPWAGSLHNVKWVSRYEIAGPKIMLCDFLVDDWLDWLADVSRASHSLWNLFHRGYWWRHQDVD